MKRLAFLVLVFFTCMAFPSQLFAESKKVAVYVVGDIIGDDKSIVSDAVLARMSGNKEYTAFERNGAFIKTLDKEQDYQLAGEVPEKEIREVGARLGVDYVIVVNVIISADRQCMMSARLIELESAKILKSVSLKREYDAHDVLSAMANNVAYRLLNKKSK
ncbi:MAG TPA: hypothetical protein PK430_07025 [Muribaculum sp.]|uniref:Uncharacterized protein n=1 Tax=Heminiphilus faecis TaxID=2601703 RepID=A0ABV4CXX8_9BACT|nr:hypothetical protein [Heminiphilus faecis]HRF68962.1 hypothetical protein [Muribaculum sp.]